MINISESNEKSKEEKIAAARKKLNQFKEKKLTPNTKPSEPHTDDKLIQIDFSENSYQNSINSSNGSPVKDLLNRNSEQNNHNYLSNYVELKNTKDLEYMREQLQLHVQTIGILVAEKTELQAKLQQEMIKVDLKQVEVDELTTLTKESRQKIFDLEQLVSQTYNLSNQIEQMKKEYEMTIEGIRNELNSKIFLNEELKIKLNEVNDKFNEKYKECQKQNQKIVELTSELEIARLRRNENQINEISSDSNEVIEVFNERIKDLERVVGDSQKEIASKNEQIQSMQNDYQNYVDKLQKQVENLVDVINNLTEERENAFKKIDLLDVKNKEYQTEIDSLNEKISKQTLEKPTSETILTSSTNIDDYKSQLECEIKYFKQQIEILLHENNHLNGLIIEKDNSIGKLEKINAQISEEKSNHEKLLEMIQGEKNTLSRVIIQNNELKDQLTELQNAYVILTNKNAEIMTILQGEQHNNRMLNDKLAEKEKLCNNILVEYQNLDAKSKVIETNEILNEEITSRESYRTTSIKQKEEKVEDNLLNKSFREESVQPKIHQDLDQKEVANETNILNTTFIEEINKERDDSPLIPNQTDSFKLLELKFTRVMQENADLKDKNQELEHTIMQLQCETDTIIDYISMYQIEREKLAKKYKIKDDNLSLMNLKIEYFKEKINMLHSYLLDFIEDFSRNAENNNFEKIDRDALIKVYNIITDLNKNFNEFSQKLDFNSIEHTNDFESNNINSNLSSVIVCNDCQGDLFVV